MKTVADITPTNFKLKMMSIGDIGSGKTHLSLTFPKCYVINCDPGGLDTVLVNPELKKNLVGWNDFIPESAQDTKRIFEEMKKSILEAKELAKQGKVETLVIDGITTISENRWIHIETFEKEMTRNGEQDTRSMYGKLSRWLYQFVLMDVLAFPGNVVMTALEQLESDEALDKKPDKTTPVLANILGGFRDKVGAMFSCVLFMSKIQTNDKQYHYWARTQKGNLRNAKNRFNLPETIEDVSYSKLMTEITKQLSKV